MAEVSVFSYSNYKAFLKAQVTAESENWGIMTKLAKAAGCQRPYFSRVLSEKAHLTPAQIYGLARYWKLSEEETEYFLELLELERSGSSEYREYLARKLSERKKKNEDLSNRVQRATAPNDEKDLVYYSAWYWTAIHILVSIPQFQSEKAISEKLSLPISQVRFVLETLEKWGSVRREKTQWKFGSREQHISKASPLSVFHHSNWRHQATLDAQKQGKDSVHYTVVQSLSKVDYERIKDLILDCIQKSGDIARPSVEEKLMCFTCDLFEI